MQQRPAPRRKSAEKTVCTTAAAADDPMSVDIKQPPALVVAAALNGTADAPLNQPTLAPPPLAVLPGAPSRPAPPIPSTPAPAQAPISAAATVVAENRPAAAAAAPGLPELSCAIEKLYIVTPTVTPASVEKRLRVVYGGACPLVFAETRLVLGRNLALWKETLSGSYLMARSTEFGRQNLSAGGCYKFLYATCVGLLHTHAGAAAAAQSERTDFAAWQDDALALARAIEREAALLRCPVEVVAGDSAGTVKIDFDALWALRDDGDTE